jgi:hypothetical protein
LRAGLAKHAEYLDVIAKEVIPGDAADGWLSLEG